MPEAPMQSAGERVKGPVVNMFRQAMKEFFGQKSTEQLKKPGILAKSVGQGLGNAFASAMEDPDIQARGKEYIKSTLDDTIGETKRQIPVIVQNTEEKLRQTSPAERDNYENMKKIIGCKDTDKWYVKILKKIGVRILSWSMPIANYISAAIAAKFSGQETDADKKQFRDQFDSIYTSLLAKAANPQNLASATP